MPKQYLSHRIKLKLTPEQESYCRKAAGTARYAYNWAHRENGRLYAEGVRCSMYDMTARWNAYREEHLPWSYEVTKWAGQRGVQNLYTALDNFFEKRASYPNIKKRGKCKDSFYVGVGEFLAEGKKLKIPKLGWVHTHQELRFAGRQMSVVVSREADEWFASIKVELPADYVYPHKPVSDETVGIDLGVGDTLATLSTLSTGEKIPNPRTFRRNERRIQKKSKALSRKKPGSRNRERAKRDLSREHARLKRKRKDHLHKTTTKIVRSYRTICIENLNVKGMAKTTLAKSVHDAGMYEFRRQLEYKAALAGSKIVLADRFYPSSKTCSACGYKLPTLSLSTREWVCPCGAKHDRDINAAINLKNLAVSHTDNTNACGDGVRPESRKAVKQPSAKQVSSLNASLNRLVAGGE